MLNQVILTGNLGGDPEIFFSSSGDPIAKFSLAFRVSKTKTGWIRVVSFGKLSEIVERHLHKGARIGILGTLNFSKWESDEGVQKSSFELIANSLEFIRTDGRGWSDDQSEDDIPI